LHAGFVVSAFKNHTYDVLTSGAARGSLSTLPPSTIGKIPDGGITRDFVPSSLVDAQELRPAKQ
jgi:hypothetical protein